MNLEILLRSKRDKTESTARFFWKRVRKIIFFILLAWAIFFGGWVWHRNICATTWDDKRKKEFIMSQDREVVFNERDYKKALEIADRRDRQSAEASGVMKNIFLPY